MTKKAQVLNQLKLHGYVTRNWALAQRPMITRLAGIIDHLNDHGYTIKGTDSADGTDYVYKLIDAPVKLVTKVVEREGRYYKVQEPVTLF